MPWALDVTKINVSKCTGIKRMLKKLGEDIPTYAFGDGSNDIPMGKFVDHFIAMGNATESVKNIAEYVTSSNDNGGILNGLEHYRLLN